MSRLLNSVEQSSIRHILGRAFSLLSNDKLSQSPTKCPGSLCCDVSAVQDRPHYTSSHVVHATLLPPPTPPPPPKCALLTAHSSATPPPCLPGGPVSKETPQTPRPGMEPSSRYSAAKSCHIWVDELVEVLDEESSVQQLCAHYERMQAAWASLRTAPQAAGMLHTTPSPVGAYTENLQSTPGLNAVNLHTTPGLNSENLHTTPRLHTTPGWNSANLCTTPGLDSVDLHTTLRLNSANLHTTPGVLSDCTALSVSVVEAGGVSLAAQVRDIDNRLEALTRLPAHSASGVLADSQQRRAAVFTALRSYENCLLQMIQECLQHGGLVGSGSLGREEGRSLCSVNLATEPFSPTHLLSAPATTISSNSCDSYRHILLTHPSSVAGADSCLLSSAPNYSLVAQTKTDGHVVFKADQSVGQAAPEGGGGGKAPSRDQLEKVKDFMIDRFEKLLVEPVDHSAYTTDLLLENNWAERPSRKQGLRAYTFEVLKVKVWVRLKFRSASVHVLSVVVNEVTGSVKVRWRLTGQPQLQVFQSRPPGVAPGDSPTRKQLETEWHDGVSTLYVNGDGLVYRHVVDKMDVEPPQQKVRNPLKTKIAAALGVTALAEEF